MFFCGSSWNSEFWLVWTSKCMWMFTKEARFLYDFPCFKLVVGEFLKQKQQWAKAWLTDFNDFTGAANRDEKQSSMPGFVRHFCFGSETANSSGAGSRGFCEFGCQASTFLLRLGNVRCFVRITCGSVGCGSCMCGIEHLFQVDTESILDFSPQRLWFNQLTSASSAVIANIDCHAGPHHHLLGRRLAAGVEECQWGQEHLGLF